MGILSVSSIANIASAHGVACRLRCGRLELQGRYTMKTGGPLHDEWVDATGWTIAELMRWLGY